MAENKDSAGKQMPVCRKCCHYFITHEPARPYGCRAMGFKSRGNPAMVVLGASGLHCQLFQAKQHSPSDEDEGGEFNS